MGHTLPLGQRLDMPRASLTVPAMGDCRATLRAIERPCPNKAGPTSNYVCAECERDIVQSMNAYLYRYGQTKLAIQLGISLASRKWNRYSWRMEATK